MKFFYRVVFVCLLLASQYKICNAKDLNIIEVKDLKGGIQKTLPMDEPNKVLKGRVENQAEFHVLNDIQLNINDVKGPGKASSSLTDGTTYLENMNIYGKGNLGKLDYNFNIGGKATNDNRVELRGMTFTSLQGQAKYGNNTVTGGDVFESFSQYSLNTTLKGASYKYYNADDNLPDVTVVFGNAYPKWENAFKLKDYHMMQRRAYGVNLRHDLTPKLNAGISYLRSDDSDRQADTDTLYNNNIYSLDYEYKPIKGLTVRGESAFSQTKNQAGINEIKHTLFGNAHRIETIAQGGPSRVNLVYERVNPKFETFLGSASQDRQKASAKWKYKYSKNITLNSGFTWFQNSLSNSANRNDNYKPELGVNIKRLFNRKYSEADISFKFDKRTGKRPVNFDHYTNLSYRDRLGFVDMDNNFGFAQYRTSGNARNTYDFNYSTSLGTRHNLGAVVLKPSINAGSNFIEDEILNKIDKIIEYSIGLGMDIPKHKITSNFKFGQNILASPQGDCSNKLFTSISFYYKPSFLGKLNSSTIFLRASINDFNFETRSRNFAEKSISMGLNIPIDLFVGKKNKVERL